MKRTSTLLAVLCLAATMLAQGWKANYGGVMLQGFYWDSYQDTKWTNLEAQAKELAEYFDLVWLPQSAQARNTPSMGYDDYYWFSNYNSAFGTEAELLSLIGTFRANGIKTIADVVINHRATTAGWFDFPTETYNGVTYTMTSKDVAKNDDGGKALTEAQKEGVQLSDFIDSGEDWDGMRDLDHNSANVQTTVKAYLQMLKDKFGYAGFRYDMVKGYGGKFTALYNNASQPEFSVGEYWDGNINKVKAWIESTKSDNVPTSAAFDFPIRYTVRDAVNNGNWAALDGVGLAKDPNYARYAVTFVENHDTQPGQSLASTIESWFKPSAYALILLREAGTPCVFWGDLFGTPETGDLPAVTELPLLMTMRRALAHGPQHDALDDPDVVGFAREGDDAHPGSGLAVVLSDRRAATKRLHVGARHAGEQWICVLGGHEPVTIADDGNVELPVSDGGLSVYAPEAAWPILDSAEQHLLRQR